MLRERAAGRLTVLMYHKVLPDALASQYPLADLVVRESLFRRQAQWLARHARVLPLARALAARGNETRSRRPIVSLTFDDGYRDNLDVAAPILEREGLRATFFVTTGFVEGRPLWFDVATHAWAEVGARRMNDALRPGEAFTDLAALLGWLKGLGSEDRERRVADLRHLGAGPPAGLVHDAMRPSDLRSLAAAGHEVGSHTVTHAIATQLPESELERELSESRQRIADWTGVAPTGFCYPNGNHDEVTRRALVRCGYLHACTTVRGSNGRDADPLALRRLKIAEGGTALSSGRHDDGMLAGEVLGLHVLLRRLAKTARFVRGSAPTPIQERGLY
jgi:peptidoglycan/xylan/chitin deacetylase (PgdA/CDA1 family)